jgi:hypothetical protein
VKLARLAFHENYDSQYLDDLERSLRPIVPGIIRKSEGDGISERMLLDYMMQLNIVEIRTRFHLHLLAPMYYNLTPHENKPAVERILSGLARDELSHICYTAKVIDDYGRGKDAERVAGVYMCRMHNYNQHTLDHCDAAKNDYGQGKYPMLFAPACGDACRLRRTSPSQDAQPN